MSDLFKEMCALSGKLSDLIDSTKGKDDRQNLLVLYFKVNEKCEKIAHQEFDENDDFYRDTVENIMDTERLIKDFNENKLNLINVLLHLIDIIGNVEKIILKSKSGDS